MPRAAPPTSFPIAPLLPDVLSALAAHPRLVLEAPPGAGKTTQVPLALLDAPWRGDGRILVLEPRRVAARAAAGFMAAQLGEAIGATVGYRIRFDHKVSDATRVEVVTEGILTRLVQDDPGLDGVAAIVFDEFHERHLAGDLGLALALDVQAQLRPDLRLLVMSATLDGARLAAWLDAPRLTSAGRSFPVTVAHFPARRDEPAIAQLVRCVDEALRAHAGDLLVFLPGRREIAEAERRLAALASAADAHVLPLHGDLSVDRQSEVLAPAADGRRRIVLATNVAESSVTLPGVRVVIDTGLAREPRHDPNSGFSRLEVVAISQASADQRAGRAGRVAEGHAYRLWPASQRLEPARTPEIAQVDLAGLRLELAAWGSTDLRFVDAPPAGALAAGEQLLQRLGALDDDARITPVGKRMLALGTHPRLAAMLLASGDAAEVALACDLAALVEARDPLGGADARRDDWAARHQALVAFRRGRANSFQRGALAALDQASRQWRRRLRCSADAPGDVPAHALGDRLTHAFPDRIAFQHPADPLRYALANGRMARLYPDSALYGEPWLVATDLRFDAKDAPVQRGAPLDLARLRRDFPARFVERDIVHWDEATQRLQARREQRFDRIVLDVRPAGRVDPELAADGLTDAVAARGLHALPWTDALRQWRERVRCLRAWQPALDLPDLSDDALLDSRRDWLRPLLRGRTRLDALDPNDLRDALQGRLDWSQRQALDALAPTGIGVPSGQVRPIAYAHDAPPVLAVKLQELFGLADTPRIVDGRVPVTLHLLSPGGKPLQVTQDLRGFWDRTYPEVRKEMKGRYPRHPWPEDPWAATPTHRAKPRGT